MVFLSPKQQYQSSKADDNQKTICWSSYSHFLINQLTLRVDGHHNRYADYDVNTQKTLILNFMYIALVIPVPLSEPWLQSLFQLLFLVSKMPLSAQLQGDQEVGKPSVQLKT